MLLAGVVYFGCVVDPHRYIVSIKADTMRYTSRDVGRILISCILLRCIPVRAPAGRNPPEIPDEH